MVPALRCAQQCAATRPTRSKPVTKITGKNCPQSIILASFAAVLGSANLRRRSFWLALPIRGCSEVIYDCMNSGPAASWGTQLYVIDHEMCANRARNCPHFKKAVGG